MDPTEAAIASNDHAKLSAEWQRLEKVLYEAHARKDKDGVAEAYAKRKIIKERIVRLRR